MSRLSARWGCPLLAVGLIACGKTDSLIGATRASDGEAGAHDASGGATEDGGRSGGAGKSPGGAASGGKSGKGGSDVGGGGSSGDGSSDAGAGAGETDCEPATPVGTRLVRLTFAQLSASVRALLGADAERLVQTELATELDAEPAFPPLSAPTEGTVINGAVFARSDRLAEVSSQYVRDHFQETTNCAAPPTDACAREFVTNFTEAAYRRPPTDAELQNILRVYSEGLGLGATIPESVGAAVSAVLDSPFFVYRTEFGAPQGPGSELLLGPYEVASQLSFFVSNGPPDSALLSAAREDALGTPAQLVPHIDRLLASAASRANLEAQFASYLGVPGLLHAVSEFPEFTPALRASMQAETRYFLSQQLWDAALPELLTSRRSRIDAGLAALYGVAFPPRGISLDALGFADIELPAERSGLLTQAAMLTAHSRQQGLTTSKRGAWVNSAFLCLTIPPHPDGVGETELELPGNLSERENVEYREQTAPCRSCHGLLDPPGLALGNFDAIGRYRSMDAAGRPIDASAVLPPQLDSKPIEGAAGLASALIEDDRLAACLARSFLDLALTDGALPLESCAVKDVVRAYQSSGDLAFSGLVRQIALSKTLRVRAP